MSELTVVGKPVTRVDANEKVTGQIVYGYDLVLVRPDLHVVWRGNSVSADCRTIATIATGHA